MDQRLWKLTLNSTCWHSKHHLKTGEKQNLKQNETIVVSEVFLFVITFAFIFWSPQRGYLLMSDLFKDRFTVFRRYWILLICSFNWNIKLHCDNVLNHKGVTMMHKRIHKFTERSSNIKEDSSKLTPPLLSFMSSQKQNNTKYLADL